MEESRFAPHDPEMSMSTPSPNAANPFAADCLAPLPGGGRMYSLAALHARLGAASRIPRLPVVLRVVLESLLRN